MLVQSLHFRCGDYGNSARTTGTRAQRAALAKAGGAGRQIRKHRGLVRAAFIDGKGLADSLPIQVDVTDLPLQWRDGQDLTALEGREIQLIFELRGATFYSFSFSD